MAALFLGGDEDEAVEGRVKKRRKLKDNDQLMSKSKIKKNSENLKDKNVEAIIHRGQREFREKNYFRALEEFQQALILESGTGLYDVL